MSANHFYTTYQQMDPNRADFGKWFVYDWHGEGADVAGPFDTIAAANVEADTRNGAHYLESQKVAGR